MGMEQRATVVAFIMVRARAQGGSRHCWTVAILGFHASDMRHASIGSWYGHRGRDGVGA